jgi:hypothetical protein
MGRFVVFDQETIGKLPKDLSAVAELSFGLYQRGNLDYLAPIFEKSTESLVMMPASSDGYVSMIHLRPLHNTDLPVPEPEPECEATGFLGLSDTICDPEPERRRRWWHWFWS